jgi:asparagine synthase (glutamine-hydrolysing)
MPGINFIYDRKGRLRRGDPQLQQSVEPTTRDLQPEGRLLSQDDFHCLSYRAYPEYPVATFADADWTVYLEGRFYGEDPGRKLKELAPYVLSGESGEEEKIRQWLAGVDGDFVAFFIDKRTARIGIVNDLFGRLPLYCHRTGERFILSRNLRFIANLMNPIRFDRMALAESLWIGYLLGKRTLLEGVERLPPATWIRIEKQPASIQLPRVHDFNFETKAHPARSLKENAERLAALFSESCVSRTAPGVKNVISLSGGFDSRAVAACFQKYNLPCCAATFIDHLGNFASDARIAEQIAALLDMKWRLFRLAAPRSADVLKLLRLKNGMNSLGMSFLLPYLEQVREAYGPKMVFITGDSGDKVLRDLTPWAKVEDFDGAVTYLIAQNAKFPLEVVAALTGVKESDMIGAIRDCLSSYPEEDWCRRYVHFIICERGLKWQSEGEDRNRCYFWSTTPFSAVRVFDYAMACPDEQKSQFGLYREFLQALSPVAAAVEYAGVGAPVASDKFRVASKALALLGERVDLRRTVEKAARSPDGYSRNSMIMNCIRRQMDSCDLIYDYLSPTAMRRIVDAAAEHSKEGVQNLFTITSIMEDLATGASVLEESA